MIPSQFRSKPAGPWNPWVSGSVDDELLRMKLRQSNGDSVYLNGCLVHSIKFSTGSEWSVLGGWKR